MINIDRLDKLLDRYEYVEARLGGNLSSSELKSLGQEYAELKPVVNEINSYRKLLHSLEDAKELLDDPEMKSLASSEIIQIESELSSAENLSYSFPEHALRSCQVTPVRGPSMVMQVHDIADGPRQYHSMRLWLRVFKVGSSASSGNPMQSRWGATSTPWRG